MDKHCHCVRVKRAERVLIWRTGWTTPVCTDFFIRAAQDSQIQLAQQARFRSKRPRRLASMTIRPRCQESGKRRADTDHAFRLSTRACANTRTGPRMSRSPACHRRTVRPLPTPTGRAKPSAPSPRAARAERNSDGPKLLNLLTSGGRMLRPPEVSPVLSRSAGTSPHRPCNCSSQTCRPVGCRTARGRNWLEPHDRPALCRARRHSSGGPSSAESRTWPSSVSDAVPSSFKHRYLCRSTDVIKADHAHPRARCGPPPSSSGGLCGRPHVSGT